MSFPPTYIDNGPLAAAHRQPGRTMVQIPCPGVNEKSQPNAMILLFSKRLSRWD
jgi:hypothetical protein